MDFSDRFVAKKTLGQRASVSPQVRKMRQVHPSGFEPETLGSEDRCAIQLRHGCSYFLLFYRKPGRSSIAIGARSGLHTAISKIPLNVRPTDSTLERAISKMSARNRRDDLAIHFSHLSFDPTKQRMRGLCLPRTSSRKIVLIGGRGR